VLTRQFHEGSMGGLACQACKDPGDVIPQALHLMGKRGVFIVARSGLYGIGMRRQEAEQRDQYVRFGLGSRQTFRPSDIT
jgi:hypothetical protein